MRKADNDLIAPSWRDSHGFGVWAGVRTVAVGGRREMQGKDEEKREREREEGRSEKGNSQGCWFRNETTRDVFLPAAAGLVAQQQPAGKMK